jgi:hypothetical protein
MLNGKYKFDIYIYACIYLDNIEIKYNQTYSHSYQPRATTKAVGDLAKLTWLARGSRTCIYQ